MISEIRLLCTLVTFCTLSFNYVQFFPSFVICIAQLWKQQPLQPAQELRLKRSLFWWQNCIDWRKKKVSSMQQPYPSTQPVPLLTDSIHGGLGPVKLLFFAAQHGCEALILFPQTSQLLLPPRPLLREVWIKVTSQHTLDLLYGLQKHSHQWTERGKDNWAGLMGRWNRNVC